MISEGDLPVALVTGSGQRIGAAVARKLAQQGYRLVLHANSSIERARRAADKFSHSGPEAIALQADFRNAESVAQLVRQSHEHYGRIDVLVNCAAIWEPKSLDELTPDDVRQYFEVNTLATFLCCQHVGGIMVAQPQGGAIINFGDWAISRPYADYAHYFVSKGSIPTITRTFAVELASRNPQVRVNALLPGPVEMRPDLPAEVREATIASTLVKREGTAEHMADAVWFLVRNDFVTGVCLPVDGGRSIFANDAARS